ncbi:hypothetical protein QBC34DRAFT_375011 [Podospora aff. communis PSN243]|uniref:Cation-transporting P-type ATPase C-terminal domain-containing protein n=1 Tax=Podospora aff. communis PSN243 TaxID=3040156 RepID=A0AAV9H3D3_9PEZI|nr:hypothetical protein QBC34DRAFT_375011 [Podospora aff. communis PSN243]
MRRPPERSTAGVHCDSVCREEKWILAGDGYNKRSMQCFWFKATLALKKDRRSFDVYIRINHVYRASNHQKEYPEKKIRSGARPVSMCSVIALWGPEASKRRNRADEPGATNVLFVWSAAILRRRTFPGVWQAFMPATAPPVPLPRRPRRRHPHHTPHERLARSPLHQSELLNARALLPYQPKTNLQILVQNLLYDIVQLALAWDSVDEDYLLQPHSWNWRHFFSFVAVFGPLSTALDMSTFLLNWFYYGLREKQHELIPLAQTHWFVSGLVSQVFILHVLRTAKIAFVQSRASIGMLAVTAAVLAQGLVLAFALQPPNFLGTTPPDWVFVGVLAAQVVGYGVLAQALKWAWRRVTGGQWL